MDIFDRSHHPGHLSQPAAPGQKPKKAPGIGDPISLRPPKNRGEQVSGTPSKDHSGTRFRWPKPIIRGAPGMGYFFGKARPGAQNNFTTT